MSKKFFYIFTFSAFCMAIDMGSQQNEAKAAVKCQKVYDECVKTGCSALVFLLKEHEKNNVSYHSCMHAIGDELTGKVEPELGCWFGTLRAHKNNICEGDLPPGPHTICGR